MDIGQRIRMKREELGISQEELALKAGYKSRSSINKIEKDGRGLPQSKILLIAKALDTTPGYLMGWDNDENSELYTNEVLNGINAMTSLLHYLYDSVDFQEYINSETFEVTLRKNNIETILDEDEYNLLFDFICSNIPNYIQLIKSRTPHKSYYCSYNDTTPSMVAEESAPYEANAAHERTDIEVTDEMRTQDDDIMNDENF